MASGPQENQLRLAEKLKQIRRSLGLSQNGILIKLGYQNTSINRGSISRYELGYRVPSLPVLLAYAKLANIYLEVLVDDAIDLPDLIPSEEKSAGKMRRK